MTQLDPPLPEVPSLASFAARSWREIERDAGSCTRCHLHRTRTKVVFGDGPKEADLFVVGQAPRQTEDLLGRPFVGAVGNLLDNLLLESGFNRNEVYVTNVLKCRPRHEDQDPLPFEVSSCSPFLWEQVAHVAPRVIVTLGEFATAVVLRRPLPIDRIAGFRFDLFDAITVVPTYHPVHALKGVPTVVESIRRDLRTAKAVLDGRLPTGAEVARELARRAGTEA